MLAQNLSQLSKEAIVAELSDDEIIRSAQNGDTEIFKENKKIRSYDL